MQGIGAVRGPRGIEGRFAVANAKDSSCGHGSIISRMRYDGPLTPRQGTRAMNLLPEIAALDADMRAWRHHIHAHPETAFEEKATSAFVADKLRAFGLEVHTGLAGTGVVGVLRNGTIAGRGGLARRPRRAAHPREVRRGARVASRRQDARVRPRRPHDDAARRRARDGAAQALRRHRVLHLPAGRGERGRRPRDGAGGLVRPLPDEGGVRDAQLARACRRQDRVARRSADGRLRHLRDRRDRPRRARRDAAPRPRSDAVCRARDQRAADDRRAQHPSARVGRGERDAGARRRHVERDPAGGRAARHGAHVPARDPGPDRAAHRRDRHRASRPRST